MCTVARTVVEHSCVHPFVAVLQRSLRVPHGYYDTIVDCKHYCNNAIYNQCDINLSLEIRNLTCVYSTPTLDKSI